MNGKLHDAVAIFKELGWENATRENILDLPLGSAEQKKTALAGLKSGEWGEIAELSPNTYGWRSYMDVDKGSLAVFAVCIGVDARRAANISGNADNELLLPVIARRGVKYASDFISYACISRRRMYEHSASVFGNVAVRLVDELNLDVPQNVEYMKDWSVYAAAAMGLKAELRFGETDLPSMALIQRRFIEHILVGVAVNTPATGPFGAVLPAGASYGWIPHERAVELVFSALDAAVRPGDRKVWLDVLDKLEVRESELLSRIQSLIPLLASGDTAVIVRLAPELIAKADDDLLAEVLLASFSATTKKARQLVLRAAIDRLRPEGAEGLEPWLLTFASDKDRTTSALAAQLMKQWGFNAEMFQEETNEISGFWQETPTVWKIPSFELGVVSPEVLTELAAELVKRSAVVHDVVTERFLAMANAVACQNPEAARISLQGLRSGQALLDYVVCWIKGEKPCYGSDKSEKDIQSPLKARDYVVCLQLGELPCLLSTPDVVDLSIRVPGLAKRLSLYKEAQSDVLEADLFLALTRLDVRSKTSEAIDMLHQMDVPVRLQSGEYLFVSAGQAVLTYLNNPVKEPSLIVNKYKHWNHTDISVSDSLCGFPERFSGYYPYHELFAVFPLWGDVVLGDIRWNAEVYHEQGLILRQTVRRAVPLPPGASMNLLAAQRSMTLDAAKDSMQAVSEAWERGLLHPGVADVSLLDWSTTEPSNLAALASALDEIARDGMLGVVWPILDAVIEVSLKAPRLLTGTVEFAELVLVFLPEVQFAVEQGIVDDTALHLPGTQALAQRGGSSRAVSIAKKVVNLLPPAPAAAKNEEMPIPVQEPPFDEIWPEHKEAALSIEDGVTIQVEWVDSTAPTRLFLFTLTLPEISDRVFQIIKQGWYYDMECEGQCRAYMVSPDTTDFVGDQEKQVWLHWDVEQEAMVVCDKRNWGEGKDGPLHRNQAPPLPNSLLTVLIGLLAQDGDALYFAPHLLKKFIKKGQIDELLIRKATQTLLQNPVVSPAKLVRILEKDIELLYILWPMLTECIKFAGALVSNGEALPVWVNRILDIALRNAPYLVEAANRGLISSEDARWVGLAEIASLKSKSAAVGKAKKLAAVLRGIE